MIKNLPTFNNPDKDGIIKICNHTEGGEHLGNKKSMLYNMKAYYEAIKKDPFNVMPLSFHINEENKEVEYEKFKEAYKKAGELYDENIWIIKPGEWSNRGNGIILVKSLSEIDRILSKNIMEDEEHTYIIQKYIERPLLFNKRKFDIRCYGLITSVNGYVKGYFYKDRKSVV